MGQDVRAGGEPLIDRIGTVRWNLTMPEVDYETFRLSRSLLLKTLVRGTRLWRLKVFLAVVALASPMAFGLLYLQVYVLAYFGSAGLGVVYHLNTHEFVLAGLAVYLAIFLVIQAFYRVHNRRVLRVLYERLHSTELDQELYVGDQGILVSTSHSDLLIPWERTSAFRLVRGHWTLTAAPTSVLCIPAAVLETCPDKAALVDFIQGKVAPG